MLEGFTRFVYKELGGLVSCMAPENVPLGAATEVKNIRFLPSSIRPRDGLTKVFSVPSDQSIRGLGQLIIQTSSNLIVPLVYSSDGVLYKELIVGSGALSEISTGLTAGAYTSIATAYSRAYIAFTDRIAGLAAPKQYYQFLGSLTLKSLAAAANATTATGAEQATLGDVSPGIRYGVVFFETETGYRTGFTETAVFEFTIAAEDKQITVTSIPLGPAGTIKRWVAFGQAGGSSAGDFFIIEEAQTLQEANAAFTSTLINDNTTTSGTFNFSDDFLASSTLVTHFFDKIQIPNAGGIKFFPSLRRLAYWGVAATPSLMYLSGADDPESLYGVASLVQVSENDGQRIQTPFEFRETVYVAKERSGHTLVPNDEDPASWKVTQMWDDVGPCGPEALDVCEDFVVFASRKGAYKFDGQGGPQWISWEHGGPDGLWERVNWAYGQLVSVKIDTETKRIFFSVPLDQATVPSHVITCDYSNGFSQPVIANPQNGVLMAIRGRRWSLDDISCNFMFRFERPLAASPNPNQPLYSGTSQSQILVASSADDGAVNMLDPSSSLDNGQSINVIYQPAFYSPGGMLILGGVELSVKGNGNVEWLAMHNSDVGHPLIPVRLPSNMTDRTVRTRGNSDQWSVKLMTKSPGDWWEVSRIVLWINQKWISQATTVTEPAADEPPAGSPILDVEEPTEPPVPGGLEHITDYLDMITRPQQSVNVVGGRAFNSTLMQFDPDDYDNVQFWLRAECANSNTTTEYDIIVEDANTLAEIYRIPVPASTPEWTTIIANGGLPISLPAGLYRMRLEQTSGNNQLKVTHLFIDFDQSFPTKTRLQKKLIYGGGISNQDLVLGESRFVIGGDSGYLLEDASPVFTKVLGNWDVAAQWTLESIAGNTGSLGVCHCFVALWNTTTDDIVAFNEHLEEFSGTDLKEAQIADDAVNFEDDSVYRVYSRASNATQANNSLILGVRLYVRVTGINSAATPL